MRRRSWLTALVVVWAALQGTGAQAQQPGGTAQTDGVQPVNSGANPYRVIRNWAQLNLEGRPWGGSNGVAIDRDGKSVWATDRCSPGTAPGCLGSKSHPVHHFDESGKEVKSFGGGMFVWPHGIHVDNVTDSNLVGRISVFDRNGKFLRVIGKTGTGPSEFRTPHALEFDSQGRLIVADRHNHRIQIVTKEGTFIAEYHDFGRTSGLAIDTNDVIYTADSESTEKVHPGWQRGIRIGSLKDGRVTIFIPPHMTPNSSDGAMGEGIAIDAAGHVYTAEAQLRGVTKYVKD